MLISTGGSEGRFEFTIDDATGELSFDHPIVVAGLTTHQLRSLAEFYSLVTGESPWRNDFNISVVREQAHEVRRSLALLKVLEGG